MIQLTVGLTANMQATTDNHRYVQTEGGGLIGGGGVRGCSGWISMIFKQIGRQIDRQKKNRQKDRKIERQKDRKKVKNRQKDRYIDS